MADISEGLANAYGRVRIDDRQINELIGLAHGMIADGVINQHEAEYLQKWLTASGSVVNNPVVLKLAARVDDFMSDGVLDEVEAASLLCTLTKFSGGDFELGEPLKASSLPLCEPPPTIEHDEKAFCFTGTFAYGTRAEVQKKCVQLGGKVRGVSKSTNYLVIGDYATDGWAHSAWGRKIEIALEYRQSGCPISIVSEQNWRKSFT